MITVARARGIGRAGEQIELNQTAVKLDGKTIGYISDDNPNWLLIHRHFPSRQFDNLIDQLRVITGNQSLHARQLPAPPKRSRATSDDL